MKLLFHSFFSLLICCLFTQHRYSTSEVKTFHTYKTSGVTGGLFDNEEVLEIKLSGNVRALFNNRADDAPYQPLILTYKGTDGNYVSINLRAKTRGNFRRKKENCTYPPIQLNFTKKDAKPSLFDQQDKLKLVTPCSGDNYVVREYLVYKLYNLITPKSFRARLAKVTFFDTEKKKETVFQSILLEEDEQMAARNNTKLMEIKNLSGENTETETFLKMAVFQYMIGNTDWSVPFLHNIRILSFDPASVPSVVPYDFDHSGIVNAPYALPPEQLELKSTQQRRFRGYCISDWKTMDAVIATYNRLKEDIYKQYTTCTLLDAKYVKATTRFLDDFYATINNPKRLKEEFSFPCKAGINYTIRGLSN
ncbi:MAG TPA: hypothetical protein VM935_12965 [Chitinophagaceae bacterium]|nr:hypothetical protein [Chitinophagaceae bacterium]